MLHSLSDGLTVTASGVAVGMVAPAQRQAGAQGLLGGTQTLTGGIAAILAGQLYGHFGRGLAYTVCALLMVALVDRRSPPGPRRHPGHAPGGRSRPRPRLTSTCSPEVVARRLREVDPPPRRRRPGRHRPALWGLRRRREPTLIASPAASTTTAPPSSRSTGAPVLGIDVGLITVSFADAARPPPQRSVTSYVPARDARVDRQPDAEAAVSAGRDRQRRDAGELGATRLRGERCGDDEAAAVGVARPVDEQLAATGGDGGRRVERQRPRSARRSCRCERRGREQQQPEDENRSAHACPSLQVARNVAPTLTCGSARPSGRTAG